MRKRVFQGPCTYAGSVLGQYSLFVAGLERSSPLLLGLHEEISYLTIDLPFDILYIYVYVYIITFIKISDDFKTHIIRDYKLDSF